MSKEMSIGRAIQVLQGIDLTTFDGWTDDRSYMIEEAKKTVLAELELKAEQVKMLNEAYTTSIKESRKWFDIAHDSISKGKIIAEIERLNNSDGLEDNIAIPYLQKLLKEGE